MRAWVAGAAGVAAIGVMAAARSRERRAAAAWDLEAQRIGPEVTLRDEAVRLPFRFHRSDGFTAVFGADAGRVRDALPSAGLHPVLLQDGRAAVLVGAFHHREQTIGAADGRVRTAKPYGEVMVAALVTPRLAPPVAPLFATDLFGVGGFVFHLPVTSRLALDAGRLFGLPKFVADMAFSEEAGERSVVVAEGGRELLSFRVRPSGRITQSWAPMVVYGVRDTELIRTAMPGVSWEQVRLGRAGGRLELGGHPVADTIRALGTASEPFATTNILTWHFLIPAGQGIGAATSYLGYAGVERDFGSYTIRHAGTPPIDQYAHRDALEWWEVPGTGGADHGRAAVEPVAVAG